MHPAQWSGVLESGLPPHWGYCCAVSGLQWQDWKGFSGVEQEATHRGWMGCEQKLHELGGMNTRLGDSTVSLLVEWKSRLSSCHPFTK